MVIYLSDKQVLNAQLSERPAETSSYSQEE